MKIQIRYFASLRETLGAQESIDMPAGSTLGALRDVLVDRSPRHAEVLARGRAVRCALAQRMCRGIARGDAGRVHRRWRSKKPSVRCHASLAAAGSYSTAGSSLWSPTCVSLQKACWAS